MGRQGTLSLDPTKGEAFDILNATYWGSDLQLKRIQDKALAWHFV
jgi:hypothetical protein